MRFPTAATAFLLLALLARAAMPAPAKTPPPAAAPDVGAILAACKAASGGAAWDRVRTLRVTSRVEDSGLTGSQTEWDDVLTGRSAERASLGPYIERDASVVGYEWAQDEGLPTRVMTSGNNRSLAATDAYFVSDSFWYPGRRPGAISYDHVAVDHGRRYDVLRVLPAGGYPLQLWIDQATHLIARTVETEAESTVTDRFERYTAVAGGVMVPFVSRENDGHDPHDTVETVTGVAVNAPLPAGVFAPPPAPAPDYAFAGGALSTSVPLTLAAGHLFVPVAIDGHRYTAVFDSGGFYVVSPAIAHRLALRAEGASQVRGFGSGSSTLALAHAGAIRIGGLTIRRPLLHVVDLPLLEDNPIVGYELLQQFTITLDLDRGRMILSRAGRYAAPAGAITVPCRFDDRQVEVDGSVDGAPGVFVVDTGNDAALNLSSGFVAAHPRLKSSQNVAGFAVGMGAGGLVFTAPVRVHRLMLGAVVVRDPSAVAGLDDGGVATDTHISGFVGEPVLARFNVTFDYARYRIIFQPRRKKP